MVVGGDKVFIIGSSDVGKQFHDLFIIGQLYMRVVGIHTKWSHGVGRHGSVVACATCKREIAGSSRRLG